MPTNRYFLQFSITSYAINAHATWYMKNGKMLSNKLQEISSSILKFAFKNQDAVCSELENENDCEWFFNSLCNDLKLQLMDIDGY